MPHWEIRREQVYRLYRNGSPIVDVDGRPMAYDDLEEAQYIMEHWGLFGMKTLAEVRGESGTQSWDRVAPLTSAAISADVPMPTSWADEDEDDG